MILSEAQKALSENLMVQWRARWDACKGKMSFEEFMLASLASLEMPILQIQDFIDRDVEARKAIAKELKHFVREEQGGAN